MPDLATDDVRTDDDWEPAIDDDAPPARPRRRLVTPLTVGLCGVLVAAAGFLAGVQVQKGSQSSGNGGGGGAAAGLRAGFAGGGGAAGTGAARGTGATAGSDAQTQATPTFGTVANKKGATLYVKDADGTTVRVKTNAQSKVTRNAAASAKGIYPGDTVVVQGTKDKSGNLVATQITATSKTAAASGGGGFGGGGGGGLGRRFAPPGGG